MKDTKKKKFDTEIYIEKDGKMTVTKVSPELLDIIEKVAPRDKKIKILKQKMLKGRRNGRS